MLSREQELKGKNRTVNFDVERSSEWEFIKKDEQAHNHKLKAGLASCSLIVYRGVKTIFVICNVCLRVALLLLARWSLPTPHFIVRMMLVCFV